jgi:hypothetical protein
MLVITAIYFTPLDVRAHEIRVDMNSLGMEHPG